MDGVSRCRECIRAGRSCDGNGVSISSAENIKEELLRLNEEREAAEKRLLRASQESNEAIAALSRLRRQEEFLRKRTASFINRGLQSLEESEEQERTEVEASASAAPPSSTPPSVPPLPNDFDWSGVDLGSPSWLGGLGSTAWVGQGVGGGTVQSPPEPSQGAS
ncbi:hypothetical protein F5Y17DRAFT_464060 [Xylariaceae sp. FL0594]|nr:hypothetical protein F5Y17DRAFT_464060 [Xylariaceae sp. FL0594]